jgi:hypothetical protein
LAFGSLGPNRFSTIPIHVWELQWCHRLLPFPHIDAMR